MVPVLWKYICSIIFLVIIFCVPPIHHTVQERTNLENEKPECTLAKNSFFFPLRNARFFAFLLNIFLSLFGELWNFTVNDWIYLMRVTESFAQHSLNISHNRYLLLCCQRMGYLAWCWSCLGLTLWKLRLLKMKHRTKIDPTLVHSEYD